MRGADGRYDKALDVVESPRTMYWNDDMNIFADYREWGKRPSSCDTHSHCRASLLSRSDVDPASFLGSKVDGRSGIFASTIKWTNKECSKHNPMRSRTLQTLKRFKLQAAQFEIIQNGKMDLPEDGWGQSDKIKEQR